MYMCNIYIYIYIYMYVAHRWNRTPRPQPQTFKLAFPIELLRASAPAGLESAKGPPRRRRVNVC